jgi:hypothetical protein
MMAYALFGQYVANHYAIQSLANYIMEELSPRVDDGFQWEDWFRKRLAAGRSLEIRWISTQPVVFPGISLIALAWVAPYILFANNISTLDRYLLGVVWSVGLAVTIMSFYAIARLGAFKVSQVTRNPSG